MRCGVLGIHDMEILIDGHRGKETKQLIYIYIYIYKQLTIHKPLHYRPISTTM